MKKFISIITIAISLSLPLVLFAQAPPHPNGGNAPSGDANRVGHGPDGAPIGGGTIILTLLAATWGGRKVYKARTEK